MRMITPLVLVAALGVGTAASAGLQDETDLNNGLLVAAVAEKIQRECSTIGARMFRARAYANELKERAEARGYTMAEIEAYVDDSDEKRKMRERRNAYFKSKGASNLDPDSLCVLGHAEINKNSPVGQLLRAK
ncbi:hypothetical protein EI983_06835 [Roseovarius faecimaris]|uniref:DUF5333 domain-containing protein n=1 Tax=Roseovarius faecimaris TaxID=2494550 RepID=A0A6I6IMZ2_9RHOB|nr:DUF5333 domain-containing protein [Roseovarius faecimaris]QGX98005.1 hypothetical protein EI983_06835 [Roseovarius faecimaris]